MPSKSPYGMIIYEVSTPDCALGAVHWSRWAGVDMPRKELPKREPCVACGGVMVRATVYGLCSWCSETARAAFNLARSRGACMDPRFTPPQLAVMIAKRGNCYLCDASLEHDYHIDHIFPISRGGAHGKENIGFLCSTCNIHKNNRTVEEYIAYLAEQDSPRIQRILARADSLLAKYREDAA